MSVAPGEGSVRLNIGAGDTVIEGFTAIDRKLGTEAFPLDYPTDSVDEIRASHILEHFSFGDATKALEEWHRVLKPGGVLKIAVPDFDKIDKSDPKWPFYVMGGQTDADNFHRSVWDQDRLGTVMDAVGFDGIKPWHSDNTDTASHSVSLNLEGSKGESKGVAVKVAAMISLPRLGFNDHWGCTMKALAPLGIPVWQSTGVFWGQCMQRMLERSVRQDIDWMLTLDYDTMFTAEHVELLMGTLGNRPDIDALAAMQCRRAGDTPLLTVGHDKEVVTDGSPILVTTAHFGFTLIRVEALKDVIKPWFDGRADKQGEWGDDRLDPDIWFWHQWRLAGRNIYCDPTVRVGHLELVVNEFDEELNARYVPVNTWRDKVLGEAQE